MSLMKSAWRSRLVAAAAAATMLASAGCSAATKQSNQSSGVAGAPRDGGTLVVAQAYDADPGSFIKTAIGNIVSEYAVFETLTRIDINTGEPTGVLAKSWTLAPDAKSMTITLRDDVTFHSGRKLNVDDVIFVLKKAQDPAVGAANQSIAAQISGMERKGDYELALTFKQPLPNIFDLFETMPILNKDSWADYAAGKHVDGTGRFEWKSYTPGGKIVLTKYAGYRDAKDTHLDSIEIEQISDATALTSAIRSGHAQYAVGVAPVDARSLSQQPGFAPITSGGSAFPLAIDVTKPPFDNKLVRQAIQYAIDRDRIVQQVEGGKAQASSVPWRSSTIGYDTAQAQQYSYQPDKAKQLLAEAGVKPGTSFDVVMGSNPEPAGIFQIVKNNLAAVGLDAKPVVLTLPQYEEKLATRSFNAPMVLMQAGNGLSPASAVVARPELMADNNVSRFKSPEYDKLVHAVTSASVRADQEKALHDFNAYFIDQAFAVPLIIRPTLTVRSSSLNNVTATQMGFLVLGESWLSK